VLENEGQILRNRLKGTGKKMPEIASILGMTRQNLNYHLRKEKLDDAFKRLINDKEKAVFQLESIKKKESASKTIGGMAEDILYLKASEKIQGELLCKILAKLNKTTLEFESEELGKSVSAEASRLFDEL